MNLPSLDYKILTSLQQDTRTITIVFPPVRSALHVDSIPATLGILLLSLQIEAGPEGLFRRYLNDFLNATDGNLCEIEDGRLNLLKQTESPQARVYYNDSRGQKHRVNMVAAADGQMVILVILDAPIEAYDIIGDSSASMIQSIHFED